MPLTGKGDGMITDAELRELGDEQRADLMRRLVALDMARGAAGWEESPTPLPPAAVHAKHRFLLIITLACAALIPWIAVLAWNLPPDYVVANWAATWVGLDTVLLACLASTAWLAYRSRQMVIVMALVTGTLLLCDAWFDVLTASSQTDVILSVVSAVLVEIPLGVLLFGGALRLIRLTVHRAWALAGHPGKVRLWRVPLLVPPPATDSVQGPVKDLV
jgi:Zn-dependent protease with chaperone function